MWIIGALIGLLIGGAIHRDLAGLGLLAGGLLGYLLARKKPATERPDAPNVLTRLARLEDEVFTLRREMRLLRTGVTSSPEEPSSAAAVPPFDEITEPEEIPIAPVEPQSKSLPEPTIPIELPAWLKKLWGGNPLAKIGIVLLFFGVASGLRLAADYGLLPVELRLLVAAAGGIALIVFGLAKARTEERRNFGLAVQGGGFALLYLVGYFMLARYTMIGTGLAFGLFAALGVVCVFLAARQDGPALAVLGLSGAFLAPVLAGGHADSPLPLFSYFALLNVFILTVDWFKSWRVLNIAGFIFTFAVGMAWAVEGYRTEHFLVTEIFVIIFLAAYSAMPAATALLRAPGLAGWREGMLLFGTPLIGGFLQAMLMEDSRYGLAWSALIGSLWYFALWALLFRRPEAEIRLIERSHLGIALALLTVAVPLAFDAQVTSAFWAAEGSAVLWFGVRQRRALAQATGLAMQLIAGVALLMGWHALGHRLPVANDAVLGAFILSLAGLFSARQLRTLEDEGAERSRFYLPPVLPFIWAMLWWLGTGLDEIDRFAPRAMHAPYGLLFVAVTVLILEGFAKFWRWPQIRAAAILLLVGMWLAVLAAIDRAGHPLAGMMALVLPLAFALHYLLLAAHERRGAATFQAARHIGAGWLLLFALAVELAWQAQRHMPQPALWEFVAVAAVLAAGTLVTAFGVRRGRWPFVVAEARYVPLGTAPLLAGLALVLPWGNLSLSGTDGLGWPYLPLLNVFDITQLAGLGALLALTAACTAENARRLRLLVAALAFIWLSALAARIAHHWGGVPFESGRLMDSLLFQALLTLFWTVTAIATMIHASRRGHRARWYGGIGLLGVVGTKLLLFDAAGRGTLEWTATLIGVALLVLAASYFAPLPPKLTEDVEKVGAGGTA
jgi:uncharacterized membrane protein